MIIQIEQKEKLKQKTRRLGTNIDTYLKEFKDVFVNYKLKDIDDFLNFSKKYKRASKSTIKQIWQVFLLFGIINLEGKIIIPNFNNDTFSSELTKTTINNVAKSRTNKYINKFKNIEKLFNNFVIVNSSIYEFDSNINSILCERIKEFKSSFISINEELSEYISKEWKRIFESCGIIISSSKKDIGRKIKFVDVKNGLPRVKENFYSETKYSAKKLITYLNGTTIIQLTIPFYQRKYVWTKELMKNLLIAIAENDKGFLNLGNLLVKPTSYGDELNWEIIDGQQRITSLLILFDCISKILKYKNCRENIPELTMSSEMIKKIVNKGNQQYINDLKFVLELEADKIGSITQKELKSSEIIANYEMTYSFLNEYDVETLLKYFEKLDCVYLPITFDKISNPIELFINTNSLRKPLSNYDLIKSSIIYKMFDIDEIENEEIVNMLEDIHKGLKFKEKHHDKEIDNFFKLYLDLDTKIEGNPRSKSKDLFLRFRQQKIESINTHKDILSLLKSILFVLESYRILKSIEDQKQIHIEDYIFSLGTKLKSSSIYDIFLIYIINTLRDNIDDKNYFLLLNEFRKVLLLIEKFEIKWKLFTFRGDSLSSSMGNLFSNYFRKIKSEIQKKEFQNIYTTFRTVATFDKGQWFMSDVLNNEKSEQIKEILASVDIKTQKVAPKILNRVSYILWNGNSNDYKKNSNSYYIVKNPSIEHIFPQEHSKWANNDRDNSNALYEHLDDIGNKFIFNKDSNSSAGNKVFKEKIKEYEKWNELKQDKTIDFIYQDTVFKLLEKSKWVPQDIKIRSEYIIKTLLDIWNKIL